jgi:hypothetical protein
MEKKYRRIRTVYTIANTGPHKYTPRLKPIPDDLDVPDDASEVLNLQ